MGEPGDGALGLGGIWETRVQVCGTLGNKARTRGARSWQQ